MLLNKQNVHLTQPTPALTPVYLTSRRGVDTEDGSLASDHDYHIVICSVTRGLVQRPGRLWTPCVTLPTNPAPYTIVEWGIQTARYICVQAKGLTGTDCNFDRWAEVVGFPAHAQRRGTPPLRSDWPKVSEKPAKSGLYEYS